MELGNLLCFFYSWLVQSPWGYLWVIVFLQTACGIVAEDPLSTHPLMCFPGPGHPPGVLVSHDHWRAAPQSHRHSKSCFCFCILMTFYVSTRLNSKSCLQPASLRSPLMFSLVNYTSAFSEFKVLPSAKKARLSGYLLMLFRVASCHPGWVIAAWGSSWRSPKCNVMQLSNAQSHWVKGLLADVSQPKDKVTFVGESPQLMTHRRSPPASPPLLFWMCVGLTQD